MKMLDRQEYDDLMSYLKPVFKKIWAHENDERQNSGYGFKPVTLTKLMKMAWKVPQFIQAKFMK